MKMVALHHLKGRVKVVKENIAVSPSDGQNVSDPQDGLEKPLKHFLDC